MNSHSCLPLNLDGSTFRGLLDETGDFLGDFLDRLPLAPVYVDEHGCTHDPLDASAPPENGRPLHDLLAALARAAEPGPSTASGGFMAAIPNCGLAATALADLISNTLNKYTGVGYGAPGLVALEHGVTDWLVQIMGLPPTATGLLTSGASMATVSALACVREATALRDLYQAVIYVTDQTHPALAKAARLLGYPRTSIRQVPVDDAQHMSLEALENAVRIDRAAGLTPVCLVANAGTANTGAVDPLEALANIAAREGLWFHVDAAYGGFFRLTERGRARLTGVERADSLVVDPHESLFLPSGTGALLVRDDAILRRAHAEDEIIVLRDFVRGALPDFSATGPELTRPLRGLRLWLPLQLHGVAAFRHALDAKLDLARRAYDTLSTISGVEVQSPPELSIATFRIRTGGGAEADDLATDELVRAINSEGRVMIGTTRVMGRTLARIAILGHRTGPEHFEDLTTAIRKQIRKWV